MKEEYLHYLFRFKLLGNTFETIDGKPLEILNFGQYNTNAGPDFLNTQIKYDNKIWSGSIEFHVKSSDWYLHKHQNDEAYKNVIAHFVYQFDQEVKTGGFVLPTVELKNKINPAHYQKYIALIASEKTIPCQNSISTIDDFVFFQQKEKALVSRLVRKSKQITNDIEKLKGDIKKSFYLSLARVFGGKVNSFAFESLVTKLDLVALSKTNSETDVVTALLFGVSGLLPKNSDQLYVQNLIKEYNFQKHRLNLNEMPISEWRFSRMHPHGFPTIRLAQFSEIVKNNSSISTIINENVLIHTIHQFFNVQPHSFWNTHFRFESETKLKSATLSKDFIDLIIINAIVPFIFAQGILLDNETYKQKAIDLLLQTQHEKNTITNFWKKLGIKIDNAFDTQALIEQKNEYCSKKKCLFCTVGSYLLKS